MNNVFGLSQFPPTLLFIVFLWSLLWKGLALWKSANLGQKIWFIVILIFNTVGILEIIYLFAFAKKKMKLSELKFWEQLKAK
jgi:hypothetical protein